MDWLFLMIQQIPLWKLLLCLGEIVLIVLILLLWRKHRKNQFIALLDQISKKPELADGLILNPMSANALDRKLKIVEVYAKTKDPHMIEYLKLDTRRIDKLLKTKRKKEFIKVLKNAPEKGLFPCFLLCLEKPTFVPILMDHLEKNGESFQLRRLGLSGCGEDFDGKVAHEILKDKLGELRELTGDPEWISRYFAINILIHDTEKRSVRAVWKAFSDSNARVRKIAASHFNSDEQDKLYQTLFHLFVSDPVFEVRQAAYERIQKDFRDLYAIDHESLNNEEVLHVLELLRPDNKEDENFALEFMKSANLELRFAAACYLEKSGLLVRLCRDVDLGDKKALQRNLDLLKHASEVHVSDFLNHIESSENPAALYIAASILKEFGNRLLISVLVDKVVTLFHKNNQNLLELYQLTFEAVSQRGTEAAFVQMKDEVIYQQQNPKLLEILFPLIPSEKKDLFLETLFGFFEDPEFGSKELLRNTLSRMPLSDIIPKMMNIVKYQYQHYPLAIRIQAVQLLGALDLGYCLQTLLETMPILSVQEAKAFGAILMDYPKELVIQRVRDLLKSGDAGVLASVISILPITKDKDFIKIIERALKDADPDVRIASVWALVDFESIKSCQHAAELLRDPVERVRLETARALGNDHSKASFKLLNDVLFSEQEVPSVIQSVITGLGIHGSLESIDALIQKLDASDPFDKQIIKILSKKTEEKELVRLVENFKDASQQLRDKMSLIFMEMDESGEQVMAQLLQEDLASLNPFIIQILESTGYVEEQIRKLAGRDPLKRREAATFLSHVGTLSAFRGIVLAAKDPDEEVRVQVTRALEKLETKEGEDILKSLKSDPNRRVRKYTDWALERLKAKSLQEKSKKKEEGKKSGK